MMMSMLNMMLTLLTMLMLRVMSMMSPRTSRAPRTPRTQPSPAHEPRGHPANPADSAKHVEQVAVKLSACNLAKQKQMCHHVAPYIGQRWHGGVGRRFSLSWRALSGMGFLSRASDARDQETAWQTAKRECKNKRALNWPFDWETTQRPMPPAPPTPLAPPAPKRLHRP